MRSALAGLFTETQTFHRLAMTKPILYRRKKAQVFRLGLSIMAEWTGLEPATPGVTGRYSNQL
ncbi:hypothetical protein, partial [Vibrio salilacus]|uniref:hypothetical protein n=1 Tax=Vibrio salilacus TaxID=1323749 RepID=UPI001C12A4B1